MRKVRTPTKRELAQKAGMHKQARKGPVIMIYPHACFTWSRHDPLASRRGV